MMNTRGKARPKANPLLSMNPEQIRDLQSKFNWERQEFEAQRSAAEAEAARLGKRLVEVVTRDTIELPGFEAPVVFAQKLQYQFERPHKLRKKQRPLCGATCRDGHRCEARVVVREDGTLAARCKLHGGLSTGPKTAQGRAAIGEANRARMRD